MKRALILIAAAGFALTAFGSVATAATPKAKAAATLKCPACGMPMPTHKTAAMTVPVKVGGKTYYCCAGCPAGKKALAAMHKKKTM